MPAHVITGSPIILDLSEAGGGQLQVGNNTNDNKVFLQGVSTNGQANASELLITGRFITNLPLVSVLADITRIIGDLQIGEGFNAAFTVSPSDASPNAGFIRFGDSTGWQLHIGRAREGSAGALNAGTNGVLMTILGQRQHCIGTTRPRQKLDIDGNLAVSGDVLPTPPVRARGEFTIGSPLFRYINGNVRRGDTSATTSDGRSARQLLGEGGHSAMGQMHTRPPTVW